MIQTWGTNAEAPLLDLMALTMIATGVVTYIALQTMPAPYGRYATTAFGPMIPANIAWFIQECPSFFVPLLVYYRMNNGFVPLGKYDCIGLVFYLVDTSVMPFLTCRIQNSHGLVRVTLLSTVVHLFTAYPRG